MQLTTFLSLFGITPWYNFEQKMLFRPRVFRCFSSSLTFGLVSVTLWLANMRYHYIYGDKFSTGLICDIFLDIESFLTICLVLLGTAYWNSHVWVELFDLNSKTVMPNEVVTGNVVLKHPKRIFILGHLFLLVVYSNHLVVITKGGKADVPWFYLVPNFLFTYYEFMISFIVVIVAASIEFKYVLINRLFNTVVSKSVDVSKYIRKIRKLFLYVDDIVDCFNELFGWSLGLLFFNFVLDILTALITATRGAYEFRDGKYSVNTEYITTCGGYLLQSGVWLTAIIFSCDSVVREADELLTNCYRLEQTLPLFSRELEELESLKRLIKNKRPKLTAAGFFEIRRSTLLSLLSTTTTYFIVALQFNSL